MWTKKLACMVLTCAMVVGTISTSVNAEEMKDTVHKDSAASLIETIATGSFSMSIPANSTARASSSFQLVAGETVTIKASYAPFTANIDIGLVAPNGKFYYFSIGDGSIDKTIRVNENGNYILQLKNNSNVEVKVSGFVNY